MRRSRCIMHRQSAFFICQSGIFFLIEYKKTRKEAVPGGFPCFFVSGAYGIRTRDLLHAMETRSQLR